MIFKRNFHSQQLWLHAWTAAIFSCKLLNLMEVFSWESCTWGASRHRLSSGCALSWKAPVKKPSPLPGISTLYVRRHLPGAPARSELEVKAVVLEMHHNPAAGAKSHPSGSGQGHSLLPTLGVFRSPLRG